MLSERNTRPVIPQVYQPNSSNSLIDIRPGELGESLQQSGLPPVDLTVYGGLQRGWEIAKYNPMHKEIEIYAQSLVRIFRNERHKIKSALDGTTYIPESVHAPQEGRIRKGFSLFMQKMVYDTQRNKGEVDVFSGLSSRRERYLLAARQGFKGYNLKRHGDISSKEGLERANKFMDRLLEKASPRYVAWILAHEYEHARVGFLKGALRAIPTLTAFLFGKVILGLILAPVGYILGTYVDENISYRAGDKHFKKFLPAVKINHRTFQQQILES